MIDISRTSVLLVLLAALASLFSACGGEDEVSGGRLVLYETLDPTTLDPARSQGVFDGRVCSMIFSGLLQVAEVSEVDEAGAIVRGVTIQPDLAEWYRASEDQMTFMFLLRNDIHFANGEPITAHDVKWSFERVLDPETRSGTTWVLERILGAKGYMDAKVAAKEGKPVDPAYTEGIPGITVLDNVAAWARLGGVWPDDLPDITDRDDCWLTIALTKPYAPFLSLLSMPAAMVVSATAIRETEEKGIAFEEQPGGYGAWKLDHWTHDSEIVLVRNEDYWGEKPAIEEIRFRIIPKDSTAVYEFETNGLDVVTIPGAQVRRWLNDDRWDEHRLKIDQLNTEFLVFNTTRKPFDDLRVRQAIVQALDIELILETVREGMGTQAHGVIPPGLVSYDPEVVPFPHDPDASRQLLAEAGLPNGFECEVLLTSIEGNIRTYMEAIQDQLSAVNIRLKLTRREWSTFRQMRNRGEFDIAYYNWYADYADADNFLYPLFCGARPTNKYFNDSDFDFLIDKAQSTLDQGERIHLYRLADQRLYRQCAAIFLWHRSVLRVVQPRVHSFREPVIFNGTRYMNVTLDETGEESKETVEETVEPEKAAE